MSATASNLAAWRARVEEARLNSRITPLTNADAMALALQLTAFEAVEWPGPSFTLPAVTRFVDRDDRPDLRYCEELLALAESPAFDTVVAMFDLVRSVDKAYLGE